MEKGAYDKKLFLTDEEIKEVEREFAVFNNLGEDDGIKPPKPRKKKETYKKTNTKRSV